MQYWAMTLKRHTKRGMTFFKLRSYFPIQSLGCICSQRQPDPVHTTSGIFKNAALFFSVTFTVHTNPQENGAFPTESTDALQTGGIWKRRPWAFSVIRAFRKRWSHDNHHVIAPSKFSLKTQIQNCSAFNILQRSVDVKHLKSFQSDVSPV